MVNKTTKKQAKILLHPRLMRGNAHHIRGHRCHEPAPWCVSNEHRLGELAVAAFGASRERCVPQTNLHIHDRLKDGVLGLNLEVADRCIQSFGGQSFCAVQDLLSSDPPRVTCALATCRIEPLPVVVEEVIKIRDDDVILWALVVRLPQSHLVSQPVRVPGKDRPLAHTADDVVLSGAIWGRGQGLHSSLVVSCGLQDLAHNPAVQRAFLGEQVLQQLLVAVLVVRKARV
mmetsp:Transcript_102147/g.256004  ORF Transcript_102147/g.256004 Transcript_102147/m.256004 type:complete len:230 (-) Transcript_102147:679-1368(-)